MRSDFAPLPVLDAPPSTLSAAEEMRRISRRPSPAPYPPAIMSSASISETEQLQQYWCAAVTELAKDGQTPLIHEFPRIGGWFAIEALRRFLTPDELVPLSRRSRKHLPGDDVIHPSPREDALKWLSTVIPSPPVKYTLETSQSQEGARQSRIWIEWIAAHEGELRTMQPTGEHVAFSAKACTRDGKPAKNADKRRGPNGLAIVLCGRCSDYVDAMRFSTRSIVVVVTAMLLLGGPSSSETNSSIRRQRLCKKCGAKQRGMTVQISSGRLRCSQGLTAGSPFGRCRNC